MGTIQDQKSRKRPPSSALRFTLVRLTHTQKKKKFCVFLLLHENEVSHANKSDFFRISLEADDKKLYPYMNVGAKTRNNTNQR